MMVITCNNDNFLIEDDDLAFIKDVLSALSVERTPSMTVKEEHP